MHNISTIAYITNAKFLCNGVDIVIEHLLIDSRKILFTETSLFFAINTATQDANIFVKELYQKGVTNFLVDETFVCPSDISNANVLQVENVVTALQQIAAFHRLQFTLPLVGITGSNGKTIVKEWLFQLLQLHFQIIRSPKSYNSQIGVPLSIWPLQKQHNLGLFEAGISQPGEMANLAKILSPSIGLFTSLGDAHSEGFLDEEQKVAEKIKLFETCNTIIYPRDIQVLHQKIDDTFPHARKISWGKAEDAQLQIISVQVQLFNAIVKAIYEGQKISISVPFTNSAAIENAISCWCVMLFFNFSEQVISDAMLQLRSVEMRLELKQGINNCTIINDSYSADITSLAIALDFLSVQNPQQKHTVILSDILQSGRKNEQLYKDVYTMLQQKNVSRFIGIGTALLRYKDVFSGIKETTFFASTADFKQAFYSISFNSETILLKGARMFAFEQLNSLLEQKLHNTVLEINLSALANNLKVYKNMLQPSTKIMAMVKAFSYGSGGVEIANVLQYNHVDYLGVAYADEGVALRKANIKLPIMVMNCEESSFDLIVQYNLEPELYSLHIFNAFEKYIQLQGLLEYPVHIKLDTGMRRLGFESHEVEALCEHLRGQNIFKVQSVFSHLVASDAEEHRSFTQQQFEGFEAMCAKLQAVLPYKFLKHIANTGGIQKHPHLQLDMVRLGIGLYGVDSSKTVQEQLKTVGTLKTTIAQIKKVPAGESVGYSRAEVLPRDAIIATVRIGYADGYPRALSKGKGKMLIKGKIAPVVGNVCMDMTMIDITNCDHAKVGDWVEVFGENLSVSEMAQDAQTIAYEILAGVSQRVNRLFFEA